MSECEKAGLPAVALCSSEFKAQATYQAEKLGLAKIARAFVAHPISDQTKAQMVAKADAVLSDVVSALTSDAFMTPGDGLCVAKPDGGCEGGS